MKRLLPKRHSLHEVKMRMLQTSAQIVSTQPLPPEMGPDSFLGKPSVAPCRLAGSVPHKSGGHRVKSWPDDTHKQTHSSHMDLCLKQINKQQTSIRCSHTHSVHLKYTQIKQLKYKPDWRCTIHTPTQIVTTIPSTDNTTAHHQQITTHPLTNNNQPKDKNIFIRKKIEELKQLLTQYQTSSQYTKQNSHRKLKHQKHPTTPPYAQTENTNKEGAHHTDQGRHNFHKHTHTQDHQHTQHRTTTNQNTHRQD